jgi:radical SAM superfamily enzyme
MRYEEALVHPLVSGLVIGTRPDCVDEEKLDYLASLSKQHYVMVEYGIESCYDRTLASIGRGHDYACTCHAIQATARRGIACGGHLILGLPGENLQEMVEEASLLSLLPPLHPQIAPTTGTQRVANGSPIPLSPREPTSSLPIGTVHNAGM